jgi:4-hydroxybenzoate polyprenyltransferase/phosphoserine phosphatase
MSNGISNDNIPLVVDVDGTLINTDLLQEAAIILFKKNPAYIFKAAVWLLKGRAYLKNKIFELVQLQYESLPYNKDVINFIEKEFSAGRKIVLATASPLSAAVEISKVYPVFSEVYGTSGNINLKGKNKLQLLLEKFGQGNFDYIGDSRADVNIFARCRYAYLVNPAMGVEREVKKMPGFKNILSNTKATVKDYIKAIRAYQWIKNLLIFVPLVTSHSLHLFNLVTLSFFAFIAFNLTASAGYLLNDILDINADRKHPRKQFRPLASGKIPVINALLLAIVFLAGGIIIAARLNLIFLTILLLYFGLSFSYSLFFKKAVLYDVFILALLYSIRVFAGGAVIDIILSFWLIAFSTFIFLSLAFVKRYSELMQIEGTPDLQSRGRGYVLQDLNLLQVMGIVSGFLSAVVFSLYINSPEVTELYSKPKILWAISFLFLFWISRIWLFTTRGKMTDDPIIFAIKDVTSYVVFFLTGILIMIAI